MYYIYCKDMYYIYFIVKTINTVDYLMGIFYGETILI